MENDISERLENFAVEIIKLVGKLCKSFVGRHIAGQLLSSSTSAGANYEEACGAESRSDFVHKLQIVLKELKESLYWLRLISKSRLIPAEEVTGILGEGKELTNIIAKSIVTAKRTRKA
jgi:four helix bundle protein